MYQNFFDNGPNSIIRSYSGIVIDSKFEKLSFIAIRIYQNVFIQLVLIKTFFLHSADSETTEPPRLKCIICGDVVTDILTHAKGHRGMSRNERKLLRSYYKLKQDRSRLRLVWTGYREKVDVLPNKVDSPKTKK